MLILKITNVFGPEGGNANYKGLDLSQFVGGSQIYLKETDGSTTAYLKTHQEDLPENVDIEEITEQEYIDADNTFKNDIPKTPEQLQLDQLSSNYNELVLLLADILVG